MTKTFVLTLCSVALCGAAAASPDFSPEDRACQLPCESRAETPTPVAVPSIANEAQLNKITPSDAERRVEFRRLIAIASNPRQGH